MPASGLCTVGKPLTEQQKRGESRQALCCSLPLLQKKKRKDTIVAFLNFQISLAGDGVPRVGADGQGEPLGPVLHIATFHTPATSNPHGAAPDPQRVARCNKE